MQLPLEELESQCALELKKLQELSPGITVDSLGTGNEPIEENSTPRGMWITLIPDVIKVVQKVLEGEAAVVHVIQSFYIFI